MGLPSEVQVNLNDVPKLIQESNDPDIQKAKEMFDTFEDVDLLLTLFEGAISKRVPTAMMSFNSTVQDIQSKDVSTDDNDHRVTDAKSLDPELLEAADTIRTLLKENEQNVVLELLQMINAAYALASFKTS